MSEDYMWSRPGASTEEIEQFHALKAGIPRYAIPEVLELLVPTVSGGSSYVSNEKLLRFQTKTHRDLGLTVKGVMTRADLLFFLRKAVDAPGTGGDLLIDLVHYELLELGERSPYINLQSAKADRIERVLSDAASTYAVGNVGRRYGLVLRVPAATTSVFESVTTSASKSSSLLIRAWENAFGKSPNPSHSYADSVRAVEVYSCPLISPKDQNATLGKDINVLRNAPQKWSFSLTGSSRQSSVEHVISMMQLLWHSHYDRHGSADYTDVTVEQAQAAVLLASTLIGWLDQGFLRRLEQR